MCRCVEAVLFIPHRRPCNIRLDQTRHISGNPVNRAFRQNAVPLSTACPRPSATAQLLLSAACTRQCSIIALWLAAGRVRWMSTSCGEPAFSVSVQGVQSPFQHLLSASPQGCPSWDWSYPYHYAPFPSDIAAFVHPSATYDMTLGHPPSPFEQLMAVLPAASKRCVPPPTPLAQAPACPSTGAQYDPVVLRL